MQRNNEELVAALARDLPRVWPAAAGARVVRATVDRIEAAMFAAVPGAHALRPGVETGWPNLFLAGDWTRHELNASMEGAVWSGRRAAEAVLARLGRAERLGRAVVH